MSKDAEGWGGRAGAEALYADRPYRLAQPAARLSAAVFSSPHSGRAYFREFVAASRLTLRRLRASEDAYVDELYDAAPLHGAPLLAAVAPRAFVDLNRCVGDIDPTLVEGVDGPAPNPRVAAGLGVVPRVVAEDAPIYAGRLSLAEVRRRIAVWHAPYHAALSRELLAARRAFGWSLLLDCHSMPSTRSSTQRGAVEVILGDRFGVAAAPAVVDMVEQAFVEQGFRVARNAPFAGGHITERYGRPSERMHAVQIEVDRGLYLDERAVARGARFAETRERLGAAAETICAFAARPFGSAEAAE